MFVVTRRTQIAVAEAICGIIMASLSKGAGQPSGKPTGVAPVADKGMKCLGGKGVIERSGKTHITNSLWCSYKMIHAVCQQQTTPPHPSPISLRNPPPKNRARGGNNGGSTLLPPGGNRSAPSARCRFRPGIPGRQPLPEPDGSDRTGPNDGRHQRMAQHQLGTKADRLGRGKHHR